jgi:hypothetical protein
MDMKAKIMLEGSCDAMVRRGSSIVTRDSYPVSRWRLFYMLPVMRSVPHLIVTLKTVPPS